MSLSELKLFVETLKPIVDPEIADDLQSLYASDGKPFKDAFSDKPYGAHLTLYKRAGFELEYNIHKLYTAVFDEENGPFVDIKFYTHTRQYQVFINDKKVLQISEWAYVKEFLDKTLEKLSKKTDSF